MASVDVLNVFKPYGFMAAPLREGANNFHIPAAWTQAPGHFADWVLHTAITLSDTVWPRWTGAGWSGAAAATAFKLTEADLDLMDDKLARVFEDPGREPGSRALHRDWFFAEDNLFLADWTSRFGNSFHGSAVAATTMALAFERSGNSRFSASIPWVLKNHLQRPRPHQAAFWMGRAPPTTYCAFTGWSPSAISGHAYQGLMACLGCYLDHSRSWKPHEKSALLELAVDIGDRRVLAGVHYPSDNVMSWLCALDAIRFMGLKGNEEEMKAFVVAAVKSSVVYQALLKSVAHKSCVDLLEQAFK